MTARTPALAPIQNGAVESAGHGDARYEQRRSRGCSGTREAAPVWIPGVMLAGNSTASGLLIATKQNIEFESGTQIQLGIVAD